MNPTDTEKMYLVDAGLAFNSPFPLILRPEREVDLILSFDLSARESDKADPFTVQYF
jgi:phospholipase A2